MGLIAINVFILFPLFCEAMWHLGRGHEDFKLMYHLDVITILKSIKLPFSKKLVTHRNHSPKHID